MTGRSEITFPLPGVALAKAVRRNIAAGTFGSIYGLIVIGAFQTGFAKTLGLSNIQLGYMTAIPLLVFPARLIASFISERIGRRKAYFIVTAILSRIIWIFILLLPFLLTAPSSLRSTLFLTALLVSSSIGVMAEPLWFSWFGDLIPEATRAKFWTKRSTFVSLFSIVPSVIVAFLKDTIENRSGAASPYFSFAIIFGFAVCCGVIDIIIHFGIPEPPMEKTPEKAKITTMLLQPMKDPKFRPYILFRPFWEFSLTLMGPFGTLQLLKVLNNTATEFSLFSLPVFMGPYSVIALLTGLQILVSVIAYPIWGMLQERYGSKPILKLSTLLISATPLFWLFITEIKPIGPSIALFIVVGLSFSGLNLSILGLLIGISPSKNRSMYVAFDLTVTSLVGALGPIVSGYFMQFFGDGSFQVFNLRINGFQILCVVIVAVRIYSRTLIRSIQEGTNVSTGYVIRRLTEANPLRVFTNIYALAAPMTAAKKVSAVSRLGDTKSRLGTIDLISHLDDPSPTVREEAIMALAKSKDPDAVDALIEKLRSPEHGLRLQSARALGQIGDSRSVDGLLESLSHSDPGLRATAATALGKLRDRRAKEPLMRHLKSEKDEASFSAYATALSELGEMSAIWHILPVMRNTTSLVFRKQLAVAIGNLLGEPDEFYRLLDAEMKVFGKNITKILSLCRRLTAKKYRSEAPKDRLPRINAFLDDTEKAYLEKRWESCVNNVAGVGRFLIDEAFDSYISRRRKSKAVSGEDLDPMEKIGTIVTHDVKLGVQLWYMEVLSKKDDPESERITFEGCLLDIYVLELVLKRGAVNE